MAELTPTHPSQGVFGTKAGPQNRKSEHADGSVGTSPPHPCPKCGSQKQWKVGKRKSLFGDIIQRWLCRNCGLRFSDPDDIAKVWSYIERIETVETKAVKTPNQTNIISQICVARTKNLDPEQISKQLPEGISQTNSDLIQYVWCMRQNGYAKGTIRLNKGALKALIKRGANLNDPDTVKTVLALEKNWSQNRKRNVITAYTLYLKLKGKIWEKPICNVVRKFPFIPTEQEIDALIAASPNNVATLLQLLKETAMRSGEAIRLQWTDIDPERQTKILNEPEKNSLPRIWNVSPKLISMINTLPKISQKIFGDGPITSKKTTFSKVRRRLAHRLQNPRLLQIHFHTLRHWKATMEYHRTKDLLHTMAFLGHKRSENTMLYVQIDEKLFKDWNDNFTTYIAHNVQEACRLVETGFEYVTGEYNDGGKIFRKRK